MPERLQHCQSHTALRVKRSAAFPSVDLLFFSMHVMSSPAAPFSLFVMSISVCRCETWCIQLSWTDQKVRHWKTNELVYWITMWEQKVFHYRAPAFSINSSLTCKSLVWLPERKGTLGAQRFKGNRKTASESREFGSFYATSLWEMCRWFLKWWYLIPIWTRQEDIFSTSKSDLLIFHIISLKVS